MAPQRATAAKTKKPTPKRLAPAAKAHPPANKARPKAPKVLAKAAKAVTKKPEVPVRVAVAAPKKKIVSGLSRSELIHFRDLLLEKRREILGDVGTMESEAFKAGSNLSNMPIHMADVGTDNFEQEFTLGLIESERQMLRDIQEALGRIEDGTYGLCIATGKPIGKVRLEAVPWAKYTKEYAQALEQGLIRRDPSAEREEEAGGGGGGGDEEEE